MTTMTSFTVHLVSAHTSTTALLRQTLALTLPGCEVQDASSANLRDALASDVVVVSTGGAAEASEQLRSLRASGCKAPVVLVTDGNVPADDLTRYAPVRQMNPSHLGDETLAHLIATVTSVEEDSPAAAALARTRHLVAAGEIAFRLQHSLNNPLTALLAEAQLMEMEAVDAEQLKGVRTIITQCRRVIDIVKRLDGVRRA